MKHTPEDWNERDAVIAKSLISPGDSVLDIGANIGQYSRFLSHCVGPTGRVYAFEPIPETFDFLSNNIRRRGLSNVEPLNFALSDTEKTRTMVIPTYRWGSECWYDVRVKTDKANPAWREI
jgi:FkbM family methyltransferase